MKNSKNILFLREIISKYHPMFAYNDIPLEKALRYPDAFNVESLIEDCLAHVGGYKRVYEHGRDFDDEDNSDSKTITVREDKSRKNSYKGNIENIKTKKGSLRVTIYNQIAERIDYLYIPDYTTLPLANTRGSAGGTSKSADTEQKRISVTWNKHGDTYGRFERYRLSSFEELAKAKNKMYHTVYDGLLM